MARSMTAAKPAATKLVLSLAIGAQLVTASPASAVCSSSKSDLFLNPYNKNSAHHRPIGTAALYASDTHASTRDWQKANVFNINNGTPFGTDVYTVGTSDPIRSIAARAICDRVQNLPVALRLPAGGMGGNLQNNTSGCPDGDVVVHDRVTGSTHHLRQFEWNSGAPRAGQYRTFDIRGLGHGTRPDERLGMAATGVAGLFGILRGYELNTPGFKIEHALRMGIPRKPGCNIMLSRTFVLPATSGDSSRNLAGYNTGNIPYGGLMALPRSVNIDTLGLSEMGARLARAIQQYGIYVGDGGGCAAPGLEADQFVTLANRRSLRHDILKLYPRMRLVLNNDVLRSPVAGGGTPIGENCAFDAS